MEVQRQPGPAEDKESPAEAGVPHWRRTLLAMVGIQMVMSLGFTMLSPVMPLFLPELGVHDPSRIDLWAGVLTSITSFIAAFASPFWGRVADRRGRKLMVIRSCFAICLFIALMSLAQTVWQFLGLRALMGVFAGFNAASITLIASQVPPRRLGYSLGWLSTGQLVGSLIGPVAGGGVADLTGSYRIPFVFTSLLTGIAGLCVLQFVHERFTPPKQTASKPSLFGSFAMLGRSPGLLPLFMVLLLAQFGVQAVQPVVTLYVQAAGGAAAGSRDARRLRLLGDRHRRPDRLALSRPAQRRAGLPAGAADLPRRRGTRQRAAGLRDRLLGVRRRAVRARPVRRRHPADGERAGRPARRRRRSRADLRHHRLGDVPRRLARPAVRRRDRRGRSACPGCSWSPPRCLRPISSGCS